MAVSYDVETSSTSADIIIHNMTSLGSSSITLRIWLNNSFVEWVEDIDTEWLLDYTYTYEGLSSNTTYSFEIEFWDYRTVVDTISGSFTTESSGGGGSSNDPYFIALAQGNTDIYVNAYDLRYVDYDKICYEITNGSYSDSYTGLGSHTFESLPSGTYEVRAYYIYNNRYYAIYSEDGYSYITVVISGSGGGSEWLLYPDDSSADLGYLNSSRSLPFNGLTEKTLYCYCFIFNTTTSVTISSSGSGDLEGWLSEWNQTGWDDTNGVPTSYVEYNDDDGENRNFQITHQCRANEYYYLWFRGYNGNAQSGTITVTIDIGSSQSWTYDDGYTAIDNISAETAKTVSVSAYTGAMFRVSFTSAGVAGFRVFSGESAYVYVTEGNYAWLTDSGVPLDGNSNEAVGGTGITFSVTPGHGYYCVWVQGATTSTSGSVMVTITPPESSTDWEEIYVGDINVTTAVRSVNRTLASRKTYRYILRFSTSGKVRIYSTGSISESDVIAYFGTTNSGINSSNGVPIGSTVSWDDVVTDGVRDYNFNSGEITVQANTTYYLWVKGINSDKTGSITIYVTVPTTDTTKGFWIYTNGEWVKVSVWVYTNGQWVKTKPCLYTNGDWIEGT